MGDLVDTVEDRIQNANLTRINNIITPRVDLAVWLINAPSGRTAASITLNLGKIWGSPPLSTTYLTRFMN